MKSSVTSGKSISGRGIALAVTFAILILTAPHEALARGGVLHLFPAAQAATVTSPRRPKLTHRLFSAAVAEDGSEIRILIDAAALPILETEARWIAANIATLGSSRADTPRSRLMYRNGHNSIRVWKCDIRWNVR